MNQEQVLKQLRETEAMLEGHFLLSSGLHSDRYFQCAKVLSEPRRAEALARALALKLEQSCDVVVGPALGAVVWSYEVARALGVRSLFTERNGTQMELRRGFQLAPCERALVVEDVLTTGGSVREVLAVLRAHGARAVGIASIINRSGQAHPFAAEDLPFTALAEVQAQSWTPETCPLCKSGRLGPAVKPGSRPAAKT
jgi:orotate phosphoribosyltransferase